MLTVNKCYLSHLLFQYCAALVCTQSSDGQPGVFSIQSVQAVFEVREHQVSRHTPNLLAKLTSSTQSLGKQCSPNLFISDCMHLVFDKRLSSPPIDWLHSFWQRSSMWPPWPCACWPILWWELIKSLATDCPQPVFRECKPILLDWVHSFWVCFFLVEKIC